MQRRDFFKATGALTAQTILASALFDSLWMPTAHGSTVSVASLSAALNPVDGIVLIPQDAQFANYQNAFNKRTLLTPLVRVLCKTPKGVATALQWAQSNDVALALRSGGHSFEGLSQTAGLAVDMRPMNQVEMDHDANGFRVGAGALLGNIYQKLSEYQRAIPAGTCPTVGITGHTLGGGYGLLARAMGLACDSLQSVDLVSAEGAQVTCSETENANLFWALRGGGAGSFGVVTNLQFKAHSLSKVLVFSMGWKVKPQMASELMATFQQWAPQSPKEITSLMKVSKGQNGMINVRCIGQSVGSEATLRTELAQLTAVETSPINMQSLDFMSAVRHFGGSFEPSSVFMKGKSDYLKSVMPANGRQDFLHQLPEGIDVIFDSYGGAIRDLADHESAFAHRENTLSSLQYYTQWSTPVQAAGKLANLRQFHEAMRPYMSGGAYFNYCDLDLKNAPQAYWGSNLSRLIEVKNQYDPKNFFRHAQSIPLKA